MPAVALLCGLLWTYTSRNSKVHTTVDPHYSSSEDIHVRHIFADLR